MQSVKVANGGQVRLLWIRNRPVWILPPFLAPFLPSREGSGPLWRVAPCRRLGRTEGGGARLGGEESGACRDRDRLPSRAAPENKAGPAGRAMGAGSGPGRHRVIAPRGTNPARAREGDGLLPWRRGAEGGGEVEGGAGCD